MKVDEKYVLQSLSNALMLIDCMCDHDGLSLTEISNLSGFGKSSCYRMLTTLEKHNFVICDTEHKYRLGYKFASIGAIVLKRQELVRVIRPFLKAITAETGETTHLTIWLDDLRVQFAEKIPGTATIRMESSLGMTMRAHLTATGKALLAFKDSAFIQNYCENADFSPVTNFSITDADTLRTHLEYIRAEGFAVDNEESEHNLMCVAVPIWDFSGDAVAAISVSGLKDRIRLNQNHYLMLLRESADKISSFLKKE